MARLTVTAEGRPPAVYSLTPETTTMGRAPDNDLVLEGDGVSRRHASISFDGKGYLVEDLGSKNGTRVNGKPLAGRHALVHGDVVALPGWSLKFDAESETVTTAAAWGDTGAAAVPASRDVVLRQETREVVVRGKVVQVPPKEYLALTLLFERAGSIVSKEDLANHVWPEYQGDVSDYNIHQVVSRLRRELEPDPAHPRVLITRPGFGYMLVV